MRTSRFYVFAAAVVAAASAFSASGASAQPAAPSGTTTPAALPATPASTSVEYASGRPYFGGQKFDQSTGQGIYESICQGCHMPGGKGAVGAGAYPAFANSQKLGSAAYTTLTVVNGRKDMPPFGEALDDNQLAAVVNYIRTNFGNHYTDDVTPADVKNVRPVMAAAPARTRSR